LAVEKVVVHVDGRARGNPGPAAVAAVATDDSGAELAERNSYIGEATNNVAEYHAILLGIDLARELGARELELVNDSELVSRQIGGQYKVKHPNMKPLYAKVMHELKDFDRWSVRSVRRTANERADELVNEALDSATGR
jgi:ribonuclease HI